ncbi:MAG: SPOR domain-containing protein [Pseudomonadota bacterium]
MSDNAQIKADAVAHDDPLAELLRLTDEPTVAEQGALENIQPADTGLAPQYAPEQMAPVAVEPDIPAIADVPDDLEAALLAELGETPQAAAEAPSADLEYVEPTPLETEVPFEAFDEPVAEVTPEPIEPPSLEDELAALLGGEPGIAAAEMPAVEQVIEPASVPEVEVSEEILVEPDLPLVEEPEALAPNEAVADYVPDEPMIAAAEAEALADDQIDLEQAIAAEMDALAVGEPTYAEAEIAPTEGDAPIEAVDDIDIDAMFAEALESEPAIAEVTQAQDAAVEVDTAEVDPLDELLGIMGDGSPEPGEAAVSEFTGDMDAAAMPPALDTTEINLGDELDMSGFDLEVDEFTEPQAQQAASSLDDALAVGAAAAAGVGAMAASSAAAPDDIGSELELDIDLDDAFDERRFEAELARDMEFASHDVQARAQTVDQVDEVYSDDGSLESVVPEKNPRGLKIAAAVGAVAILGAIGLFAFAGGSGDSTDGPIVVEADTDPVRVRPENPGGTQVPNQDRAVFAGTDASDAPSQPSLVTTSEEPVDLASLPVDDPAKAEDRLLPGAAADDASNANEAASVTPRRVRTLVVRPDGTLEERPEPAALVAETPAAPTEETPAVEDVAVAAFQDTAQAQGATATPTPASPATERPAPAVQEQSVPVRRVETQTITPQAIPQRPAEQPLNIVNPQPAAQQVAAAPAAPTPEPVAAPAPAAPAAPAASSSPFKVQIASLPSQAAAQQTSANLLSRFRSVLGGRGVAIRQADIPGRGTFYRVQVDAASRQDANNLCARYKSAGGDCIVTR